MFCKWCGGNIASSDSKCRRCGREVPALSDCGGFYDLVPNAGKPPVVQPVPVGGSGVPDRKPDATEKAVKANKKMLRSLTVLTVAGFVIVAVMIVFMAIKVGQYADEAKELRMEVQLLSDRIDDAAAAAQPAETEAVELEEPTEFAELTEPAAPAEPELPAAEPDPVLAEQDALFVVKISGRGFEQDCETDSYLGAVEDTVLVNYDCDEQTGAVESVCYSLQEADTAVMLLIDSQNEFQSRYASVSYEVDDSVFGLSDVQETCRWQHRFGDESDWEDLPEDACIQTDSAGKTELVLREGALEAPPKQSENGVELRCEIVRTNTENGSLTIVVEGITISTEANDEEQTVG